jgi:hypothetical protein
MYVSIIWTRITNLYQSIASALVPVVLVTITKCPYIDLGAFVSRLPRQRRRSNCRILKRMIACHASVSRNIAKIATVLTVLVHNCADVVNKHNRDRRMELFGGRR